jgi:hypothetical protein
VAKDLNGLTFDELENVHGLLHNPMVQWIIEQLCGSGVGGPVSAAYTALVDCKEPDLRRIGELQGKVKAYRDMHNVAEALKRQVGIAIDTKKEAKDARAS